MNFKKQHVQNFPINSGCGLISTTQAQQQNTSPPPTFWKNGSLITSFTTIVFFFVISASYYHFIEGWNILDSIYFIIVTITTIGYGDFHPNTARQQIFTIFLILFGLAFVYSSINTAVAMCMQRAEDMVLSLDAEEEAEDFDIEKQDRAMRKRHRNRVVYSIFAATLIISIGTWFLVYSEGWSLIEALYFCVVTTTTVGYGDISVSSDSGRLFLNLYIIVSVVVVSATLTNLATISIERQAQERRLNALMRPLKEDMLAEMDKDKDGKVSKWEFLSAMLVATSNLDYEKDVKPWVDRFNQLDHTGDGHLNQEDIDALLAEERRKKKEKAEKAASLQRRLSTRGLSMRRKSSFSNQTVKKEL